MAGLFGAEEPLARSQRKAFLGLDRAAAHGSTRTCGPAHNPGLCYRVRTGHQVIQISEIRKQ